MTRATEVTTALIAALELIKPDNGFMTDLKRVYPSKQVAPDKAPLPCVLVRVASDRRTGAAAGQAARLRTYEIEGVFKHTASDEEVDALHHDIIRALGFGDYDLDRKLPGLLDEEDEAEYGYPPEGSLLRTITTTVGVTYVETYR